MEGQTALCVKVVIEVMVLILHILHRNDIYEGDSADNKMCALYGLALLCEPVLLDLDNYALLDELSVKDLVYIALGYCALGKVSHFFSTEVNMANIIVVKPRL